MAFIPVNISVKGRKVVIVGGGKVALHKLKTVVRFTREVTVIAPDILPAIERLGLRTVKRSYSEKLLRGAFLVYACTDNKKVNAQIGRDAGRSGAFVNVADNKALSDFISPAVYKKGHMTVSVSSQGNDVKKSVAIRDEIKRYLESDKRIRSRS